MPKLEMPDGPEEIDAGPIVTADEMIEAVNFLSSALQLATGKPVDTGVGFSGGDLWFTVNGVEYYAHMTAKRRILNS